MDFSIPVGATATRRIVVTKEMTVGHYAPEMPEVYGTLMLVFHMEMTAVDAIRPYLPKGWVSVGIEVDTTHLAPTPVGATVTLKAVVTAVGERDVSFAVEAHDGVESIGAGTHRRAPVEVSRFMKRVRAKAARP